MPLKKSKVKARVPLKKSKSGGGTDERGVAAAERGVAAAERGGGAENAVVADVADNKFFNIKINIKK